MLDSTGRTGIQHRGPKKGKVREDACLRHRQHLLLPRQKHDDVVSVLGKLIPAVVSHRDFCPCVEVLSPCHKLR